ncbi:DUF3301 domain-containing protein [Pelomicrobium sp. G1]|uniref:DUF3301 domain-containing protein n=1 Tax=unclassified Pelomicrobium TaxID=2815318 RepID=UPI000AD9C738|nr:MAG: hypothetical protein KatS3mg123_0705 [Burkholderiales bacterium]
MTWEILAFVVLAAGLVFWYDALRAREAALKAGKALCERAGVQLLDETVSVAALGLGRDADGRLAIRRRYRFEYSDTGNNRREGRIVLLGTRVLEARLEWGGDGPWLQAIH